MVARLCDKGLLERRRQGRGFVYRPALSKQELAARALRDVLAGAEDPAAVLAHFVKDLEASPELLARMQALAGPVTLVLLSPWLAARAFDGRAPARTVATFHLLALIGMALLPLVVLPCLALVRPGDLSALASVSVIRVVQTLSHALAVVYLLRFAWVAVRLVRATSRLASMSVLAAAERLAVPGQTVAGYVLASPRPVAFAVGGRSRGVVVSRGLLGLLDDDERDAVLAHELAHLLLGHHRLLLLARIISAALGTVVPPVGDTYASLARELEVLADQADRKSTRL